MIPDLDALLSQLPTGAGPASTHYRAHMRRAGVAPSGTADAAASLGRPALAKPIDAVDGAAAFIQQLERRLPAGAKPLVARAFQAASEIAAAVGKELATPERVEDGEGLRLVLIGMRQYLELYALVGSRAGRGAAWQSGDAPQPAVVTAAEFDLAVPLLKKWGVRWPRFDSVDADGGGVVRFDDFARWALRSQLEAFTDSVRLKLPSSPHAGAPLSASAELGLKLGLIKADDPRTAAAVLASLGTATPGLAPPGSSPSRRLRPSAGAAPRSPYRVPPASKREYTASYADGGGGEGRGERPRARRYDLGEALARVGLQQHYRGLSEMGFDDVEQLLTLQLDGDSRDGLQSGPRSFGYVCERLNLMPGHRERLERFLRNETCRVARAVADQMREAQNGRARVLAARDAVRDDEEFAALKARTAELEAELQYALEHDAAATASARDAWARNEAAAARARAWLDKPPPRLVGGRGGVMHTTWAAVVHPVFKAWRGEVREVKGLRVAKRFVQRAQHVSLSRAWAQWCDIAEAVDRLRTLMRRWWQRRLVKALLIWAGHKDEMHEVAERRERIVALARRMVDRGLARGWMTWRAFVEQMGATRATMRAALSRLVHRQVAAAFEGWREASDAMRLKLRRMRRSLMSVYTTGLSRAFNSWAGLADSYRSAKRSIFRVRRSALVRAWNSWSEGIVVIARRRRLVTSVAGRLLQMGMGRAYNKWREHVRERQEMRVIAERWLQRSVGAALRRWAEQTASMRAATDLLTKYIVRFTQIGLVKAFEAWVLRTHELNLMLRAFHVYSNALLFKTFSAWMLSIGREKKKRGWLKSKLGAGPKRRKPFYKRFYSWVVKKEHKLEEKLHIQRHTRKANKAMAEAAARMVDGEHAARGALPVTDERWRAAGRASVPGSALKGGRTMDRMMGGRASRSGKVGPAPPSPLPGLDDDLTRLDDGRGAGLRGAREEDARLGEGSDLWGRDREQYKWAAMEGGGRRPEEDGRARSGSAVLGTTRSGRHLCSGSSSDFISSPQRDLGRPSYTPPSTGQSQYSLSSAKLPPGYPPPSAGQYPPPYHSSPPRSGPGRRSSHSRGSRIGYDASPDGRERLAELAPLRMAHTGPHTPGGSPGQGDNRTRGMSVLGGDASSSPSRPEAPYPYPMPGLERPEAEEEAPGSGLSVRWGDGYAPPSPPRSAPSDSPRVTVLQPDADDADVGYDVLAKPATLTKVRRAERPVRGVHAKTARRGFDIFRPPSERGHHAYVGPSPQRRKHFRRLVSPEELVPSKVHRRHIDDRKRRALRDEREKREAQQRLFAQTQRGYYPPPKAVVEAFSRWKRAADERRRLKAGEEGDDVEEVPTLPAEGEEEGRWYHPPSKEEGYRGGGYGYTGPAFYPPAAAPAPATDAARRRVSTGEAVAEAAEAGREVEATEEEGHPPYPEGAPRMLPPGVLSPGGSPPPPGEPWRQSGLPVALPESIVERRSAAAAREAASDAEAIVNAAGAAAAAAARQTAARLAADAPMIAKLKADAEGMERAGERRRLREAAMARFAEGKPPLTEEEARRERALLRSRAVWEERRRREAQVAEAEEGRA